MKRILLFVTLCVTTISFSQTYTFTNAGVTGREGPLQADVDAAYAATTLAGDVIIGTQGYQKWVVPVTGPYSIQAIGAGGGNSTWGPVVLGGSGYDLTGEFQLTAGDTIYIAIGQAGEAAAVGGGGGGTFVVSAGSALIVAGGGGGASSDQIGMNAVIANNGTMDSQGVINGGTAGNGGDACISGENNGGAGGGFITNGMDAQPASGINWGRGGLGYANGLVGGEPGRMDGACAGDAFGGFGGGGSTTCNTVGGGGGGGYSGGAGGPHLSNCTVSQRAGGGGGGSFNAGTNGVDGGAVSTSHGSVVITSLCTPTSITPDLATLPAEFSECSYDGTNAPTATNDCGTVITGTSSVPLPITTFGTSTVTWTYDSGGGLTTTQTQDITVGDSMAPSADSTSLADITGDCQIDTITPPTATDACAGQITGTTTTTLPITSQGTTAVIWTFDDGNGNTSTQTQNVILNDTVAPVADSTSLPDLVGCIEVNPTPPSGMDNCAGVIVATADVPLPITTSGTTMVTWTFEDNNGNTATLTQNVTVNTVDVSVTQSGAVLTVGQAGATYQWLDCENGNAPITGETNQTFTATLIMGNYAVEVTFNGCTDTSACTLVDFTSIDELSTSAVSVHPNPSSGQFKVTSEDEILDITLFDMLGRSVDVSIDIHSGTIDASNLNAGEYHAKIKTTSGSSIKKLVLLK